MKKWSVVSVEFLKGLRASVLSLKSLISEGLKLYRAMFSLLSFLPVHSFRLSVFLFTFLINFSYAQDLFVPKGDAVKLSQKCYKVTEDLATRKGAVWSKDKLDLSKPFTLEFITYFGKKDVNGADGFAFVMHKDPAGYNAIGEAGGGLSFGAHPSQGTKKISPSIGIEFDSYLNTGCPSGINDPKNASNQEIDHTTVVYNGDICNPVAPRVQLNPNNVNIEDNVCHIFKITWNPSTTELNVFFDNNLRLTHKDDIVAKIFKNAATDVYWGFTGSTGAYSNEQTICIFNGGINPPVANTDYAEVFTNSTGQVLNVLQNDSDPDGDQLYLTRIIQAPRNGSATIINGKINYIPKKDFSGKDSLIYEVCDANSTECYSRCSQAVVRLNVKYSPITVTSQDVTCNGANNGSATVGITRTPNNCLVPPKSPVSCSSGCSVTVNNNNNVSVNAGQQVCITATNYSGNITMSGGTLVLCGSIASNSNFNYNGNGGGAIIITGSASYKHFNINNQNVTLTNYGILNIEAGFSFSGKFINHGTATIGDDMNVNSNGELTNTGTLTVNKSLNNNAVATNSGNLVVKGDLKNNGGGAFNNNCTLQVNSALFLNGNSTLLNDGKITTNTLTLNGGSTLNTKAGSEIAVQTFNKGGSITGPVAGTGCSAIKVSGSNNANSNITGNVVICQASDANCPCFQGIPSNVVCTYLWSNGATTPTLINVPPGTYTATVTCGNVTSTQTVVIKEPALLTATVISSTNVTCNGARNGYLDLVVSGGTGPYSYAWSNGSTVEDPSNLGGGVHNVVITDAKGCKTQASGVIIEPQALTASVLVKGSGVKTTVSGGSAPYTYSWSNGATTKDLTNVLNGTYTLTVTDANNCTYTVTATVTNGTTGPCTGFTASTSVNYGNVSLTVTGGVAPFTYEWSNGAATKDLTNVVNGTYTVIVTGANNCTTTASAAVTNGTTGPCTGFTASTVVKYGNVSLTVVGGVGPYTYEWSNGAATKDLTNVTNGTYKVLIIDSKKCTATATATVTNGTDGPCDNFSASTVVKYGNVSLTLVGGVAPFTYEWSNGVTTKDLTNVANGTYTVLIIDSKKCTTTATATVTNGTTGPCTGFTASASVNYGNVTLTVEGGVGPYTYEWSNGATTKDLTNAANGTYTVLIIDSKNCTATATATVTNGTDGPCDNFFASTVVKYGNVSLTVVGGVEPFTYEWSNGATTKDLTNVTNGTYTVLIIDSKKCTVTATATVTNGTTGPCTGFTASASVNYGNVTLTVAGGVGPFTYEWSNGATTKDLINAANGTYTVLIVDSKKCTTTASSIVTNGTDGPCDNFSASTVVKFGNLTLTVAGGVGPFTYEWNNGTTTRDLTNVANGTYSVLIIDSKKCTASATAIVTNGTDGPCNGFSASTAVKYGNVSLTVVDGVGTFTYEWSNSATTKDLINVANGTYTVLIVDSKNCTTTASAVVTNGTTGPCTGFTASTDVKYGNVTLTVSGGVGPFTYEWSNGATTKDLINVANGTYTVLIVDSKKCTSTATATVTNGTTGPCNGFSASTVVKFGNLTLTVAGGVGPFTYEWNNGTTTRDLTNVANGTYSVLIIDSKKCTASATAIVTNGTDGPCNGFSASTAVNYGNVSLTVVGGVGPFTYEWSNSATTKDLINAANGTYTVLIVDSKNCTTTASAVVTNGTTGPCTGFTASTDVKYGNVTLIVVGGVGPYTYEWSNGATTKDLINVANGTYTVLIIDSKKCTVTATATVTNGTTGPCNGFSASTVVKFGNVTLTVAGGVGPFTYEWSNGATTKDLINVANGTYTVLIIDSKNCTASATAIVTNGTTGTCSGFTASTIVKYGNVSLTVTGGVGPYTYEWSNGATTKDITNVANGTYAVLIVDSKKCTATATATVTNGTTGPCNSFSASTVVKFGNVTLTVAGGVGPFTYEWNNGATTKDLTNVANGTYTILIIDSKKCTASATATVTNGTDGPCNNFSANTVVKYGNVTLTVVGGVGPYTYEWSNGATAKDLINVANGTYTILIIDSKKCTASATAIVTNGTDGPCNGFSASTAVKFGNVTLTVAGGVGPFTYEWNNGATTKDLTNVANGTYSVLIIDSKKCTASGTAIVTNGTDGPCNGFSASTAVKFGNVTLTVAGGVGPFTYEWSNGATTKDLINVANGTYTVLIIDSKKCTATATATVTNGTDGPCNGFSASTVVKFGNVTLTVAGGVAPYSYEWSNGATTKDLINVANGTYTVLIIDSKKCTATATATVTNGTTGDCNGFSATTTVNNKNIILTVNGGSGNYAYLWSNGATTKDLTNLNNGTYEVEVTDQTNNCKTTASATIDVDPCIDFSATTTVTNKNVTLTVNGGSGNYSYLWSNGATTKDLTNAANGTYTVAVTDLNTSCTASASAVVDVPIGPVECNQVTASITPTHVTCFGYNNGKATLSVYGNPPYNYKWSNGARTKDIINLAPGTYSVVVSDPKGKCNPVTASVTITGPSRLTAFVTGTNVSCPGGNNGSASVSISGGTAPYTAQWSHSYTGTNAQLLTAGQYSVIVKDKAGCSTTASVNIIQPSVNSVIVSSGAALCPGTSITLTAPLNLGYNYSWSTNSTQRSITVSQPGIYTLTLNKAGCTSITASKEIFLKDDCDKASVLCDITPAVVIPDTFNTCAKQQTNIAFHNAQVRYSVYLAAEKKSFQEAYIAKALDVYEDFKVSYEDKEHHYTLYYYDQAGNLVRTIPPAGVVKLSGNDLAQVKLDREANKRWVFTEHTLATTYTYNSLNQLVKQDVPDNDRLKIWDAASSSNGIPAGLEVNGTQFVNGQKGYLVAGDGKDGFIYITSDGGKTWAKSTSVGVMDMNAIQQVAGTSTVYAAGNEGTILKSEDGGSNWIIKPIGIKENLAHLYFTDANNGIAFQTNGTIHKTTDGGTTWTTSSALAGIASGQLTDVHFNGATGYAVTTEGSQGHIYATADGGTTWTESKAIKSTDLNSAQMISATIGFAAGADGTILKTNDGGESWSAVATNTAENIKKIHFRNTSEGCALTTAGNIIKTSDGGATWASASATDIADVDFSNFNAGYAVSATGLLYGTSDGGQTWVNAGASASLSATSVYRMINGNAYIGSNTGELKSSLDNGVTWTPITTTELGGKGIAAIHFKNSNEGTVLLNDGTLHKTFNAIPISPNVTTWSSATAGSFANIQFVNSLYGYAITSNGSIISTADGGQNWSTATASPGATNIKALAIEGNTGFMAGANGELYKTSTTGSSWTNKTESIKPVALQGVYSTGTTAYAAGKGGVILKTTNSGTSWTELSTGRAEDLTNITAIPNQTNFALSAKAGKILTFDGAILTLSNTGTATADLNDIAFVTSTLGFATGNGGVVLQTIDGVSWISATAGTENLNAVSVKSDGTALLAANKGQIFKNSYPEWINVTEIKPLQLKATQMVTSTIGYAVGDKGTIVKTEDGGTQWKNVASGSTANLKGVAFSDVNNGVAIGESGTILKTSNGTSWSPVTSGTTTTLRDVHYADGLWLAAGDGGTILKSSNGVSWTSSSSGTTQHLGSVYIIDKTTAYAVGDNGTILRGTNTGATWTNLKQTNSTAWTTANLKDVYFKDYVTGYAVGSNGVVLKTTERGETWKTENINSTQTLNSIAFKDENNAIISGANGSAIALDDQSDAFSSRFWMDRLGRVIASQNAKQYNYTPKGYSYTLYDKLGRITEVGELLTTASMTLDLARDEAGFTAWVSAGQRREITRTYYDKAKEGLAIAGFTKENLRTRVATSTIQQVEGTAYDHATHYSYDVHGNVKTLIQESSELSVISQQYKRIDYDYDLVSNKVNLVSFQNGQPDQFFHKYEYDADNRIIAVYTSTDKVIWDKDANYKYYEHGPLARMELGEKKVQGVDYAYTIQGWLKGVNSNTLSETRDIGKDGTAGSQFAKDEFGYSLGYFNGDYSAINTPPSDLFVASTAGSELSKNNLYNGNISNMVTGIRKFGVQGMSYTYDELNRIKSATAHKDAALATSNQWAATTASTDYKENYTYDANGNILKLKRNAIGANNSMDDLSYIYENKSNGYQRNTNKLRQVTDQASNPTDFDDVKTQARDNYAYDEIGNLIKDNKEGISSIEWTTYGKIKKVIKTGSTITFTYDATGNRVSKRVTTSGLDLITNYVRDASGNVMSIYEKDAQSYRLIEQPIYGSDRIGQRNQTVALAGASASGEEYKRLTGYRVYELKNHLGNVLATVSDRVIYSDGGGGIVGLRLADVKSASDYYPFGMGMPGRSYAGTGYRYGFNGKEKDDEVSGIGNQYDYGFRIYNPRIGRFFSADPDKKRFPSLSPYIYAANSPIVNLDVDGRYSIAVHYRIAYRAAIKLGFSKEMADKIAYMASTYADHPDPKILNMGGIINTSNKLRYGRFGVEFGKGPTASSQQDDPSHVTWHSMRTDEEAKAGMTAGQAVKRGMDFGWQQIFEAAEAGDINKLGQGLHAFQDAEAHKGATMHDHLGSVGSDGERKINTFSSWWMLKNDLNISLSLDPLKTFVAETYTKEALQVYQLLRGDKKTIEKLTYKGTLYVPMNFQTQEAKDKVLEVLNKKGFKNIKIYGSEKKGE